MHRRRALLLAILALLAAALALPAFAAATPTYDQTVDKLLRQGYPQKVETYLNSLGTSSLGYRLAGTDSDNEAARYLAARFTAMGLSDVTLEAVPVDAWDVQGAWVRVNGRTMVASQIAGVPGTTGTLAGEIVYVGNGTRQEFDAAGDVAGKLVVIDTALDYWWFNLPGAEATARGAAGIIMTYGLNSYPWYAPMTALGANDGEYDRDWVPIVYISRHDGAWLKEQIATRPTAGTAAGLASKGSLGLTGAMRSDVAVTMHDAGGEGYNVVATLPGKDPAAPVTIIASHHDAHFRAGLDDTGAVATQMTIAKALKKSGYTPRGDIVFLSTTAEEFGYTDCWYDWCIGAWYSITQTHTDWPGDVGAMINLELMARKGGPLLIRTNPHLMGWLKTSAKAAKRSGLLPWGYQTGTQSTWQDGWTFNTAGVPAFVLSAGGKTYDTIYHTTHEAQHLVSWPYVAKITKFAGRLAKRLNRGLLPYDPAAQGNHLAAAVAVAGDDPAGSGVDAARVAAFTSALSDYKTAASAYKRRALKAGDFRLVNTNLMAFEKAWNRSMTCLDAWDYEAYPYQQALWDGQYLSAAIDALTAATPDAEAALAALENVGLTWNGNSFSYSVYRKDLTRHAPDHPLLTWAGQVAEAPHLDVMPQIAQIEAGDYAGAAVALATMRDDDLALAGQRLDEMTAALRQLTEWLETIEQPHAG